MCAMYKTVLCVSMYNYQFTIYIMTLQVGQAMEELELPTVCTSGYIFDYKANKRERPSL